MRVGFSCHAQAVHIASGSVRFRVVIASAKHMWFSFRPGPAGHEVLRDVSASFASGAVTALIGPNGAGKSTLMRLLLGALVPTRGRVLLGDMDAHRVAPDRRASLAAYVPQRQTLAEPFSTRALVELGRVSMAPSSEAVADAIERMDLADRAEEPFAHLSAGQQQRASIARALAQCHGRRGMLVLADEPLSALDPRHALAAIRVLRQLAHEHGHAVVVAMHDLTMAVRFSDHALVLSDHGEVVAAGPARETMTPDVLRSVFDVEFAHLTPREGLREGETGRPEALVPLATRAGVSDTMQAQR
jgi:iron complex transport system ATP-binding protein